MNRKTRETVSAPARTRRQSPRSRTRIWVTASAVTVGAVLVGYGIFSAIPEAAPVDVEAAADFTLPATDGSTVSLSDLRGETVVLYFNEGAGCGSCTAQMAAIEKNSGFAEEDITVLPIVMNPAAQIQADMDAFGVTTPYLLDDGTVSQAYDVLGKGMHAGLPGHGFVLIDAEGNERWRGDYPSMWLDPEELLHEVQEALG